MTMLKAAFSAGAVLASPGAFFLDGSNSDFSLTSCSPNEVVISGAGANTLKPGHILAYIQGDEEVKSDDVCTHCSPLFRRIVEVDGNTFTTAFASFAEVFPKEVYDDSLADMLIEPQLDCEHTTFSGHRSLTGTNPTTNVTNVPTASPTRSPTRSPTPAGTPGVGTDQCPELAHLIVAMLVMGCIFPFCSLCIIPAVAMIGYITAGLGACGWDGQDFDPQTASEWLIGHYNRRLATQDTKPDFPSTCTEWKSKDTSGNCFFADCNIGLGEEPLACFSSDFPQVTVNNMISVPDTVLDSFDFGEATCNRDYCYSSLFDKDTCDNHFYANMKASCPSSQLVAGSHVIESSFPLEMPVLTQNCQVVSVLLFLGLKLFGRESYNNMQVKQLEYKQATCDQASTLQF